MAINYELIKEVQQYLEREVPNEYKDLLEEFNRAISIPNYRQAFEVLIRIQKNEEYKLSEYTNQLIGKFWHEVAE